MLEEVVPHLKRVELTGLQLSQEELRMELVDLLDVAKDDIALAWINWRKCDQ
jgi:hypothetical protein